MSDVLSLNTFVVFGYLQEANRLFFHPLGLALQVIQEGRPRLRVIDARDDPEGVVFERLDGEAEKERAVRVAEREGYTHRTTVANPQYRRIPRGLAAWGGRQAA